MKSVSFYCPADAVELETVDIFLSRPRGHVFPLYFNGLGYF